MTQRSQQSLETELSSLDNIEIQIESLSFYLINSNEKLIPILKVSINEITLSISNTFKKDIFSGYMSLALYYFNSIIFRWEPMLEKTALAFHRLTYHNEQSQVYGSFEATQPILCNISREIFLALRETMEEWNKQSQAE